MSHSASLMYTNSLKEAGTPHAEATVLLAKLSAEAHYLRQQNALLRQQIEKTKRLTDYLALNEQKRRSL
jgi:RecA-family ATPase